MVVGGPESGGLLERERAVAAVQEALRAACAGTGAALLLSGSAGVGKTSLLDLARQQAQAQGAVVLSAVCSPLEQAYTFGAVRQLVRRQGQGHVGRDPVGQRLLAAEPSGATDAFAGLEALQRWLLRLASRQPVVLLVDDVHWCDEPSLRWLGFLLRRLDGLPVALLLTVRPVDADGQALAALVTHPAVRRVELEPLSGAASARLLRERAGVDVEEDLARRCHVVTRGNPFYLHVLAQGLRELGVQRLREALVEHAELLPDGVRRGILDRLRVSGPDCVRVACAVAVLGSGADVPSVAAVAALPVQRAARAVREAVGCGVLQDRPELAFPHPLVRAALEESLDAEEADVLHRRAARHLLGATADVERASSHLVRTRPADDLWVVETLRDGARRAMRRGAPDTAVEYLRRALAEPVAQGSAELVLELGCAEVAGGHPAGHARLASALRLASTDQVRVRGARALARSLALAGRAAEAVEVLLDARCALLRPDSDAGVVLDLDLAACGDLDLSTRAVAAEALARSADREADGSPLDRLVEAHLVLREVRTGAPAQAVRSRARAALAGGALFRDEGFDSRAAFFPVIALILCDELEEARQHVTAVAEEARRAGSTAGACLAALWRSHALLRAGDVTSAGVDAEAALAVAVEAGLAAARAYAVAFLSDVLVERGQLGAAEALWSPPGLDAALPMVLPSNYVLFSRGTLHRARGRWEAAARDLLESGRRQQLWEADGVGFWPWRSSAALVLRQLGDGRRADELVEEELGAARGFGAARPLGLALRAHGLLRRGPTRVAVLQEAVEVLAGSPARLDHARACADLGAALVRSGRPDDGAALLAQARAEAHACGGSALARSAGQELEALGVRVRALPGTGSTGLTVSERRVAGLARDGLTNRQIAQELFVSPKTVETHLAHAFRKLGVRSRADLDGVEGLDPPLPSDRSPRPA